MQYQPSQSEGLGQAGPGNDPMNMFKGENANMLLNMGLSQGQTMLKTQSEKWMPGVNGFWNSLKIYFAVNNSYVVKKLMMILHPMGVKKSQNWTRKSAESDGYDQTGDIRTKWALPRDDTCAPDLYIPLMSFVTYVLLYGFWTGMSMTRNPKGLLNDAFSPEILITAVWRCFVVQICEVVVTMGGLSLINGSLPILDIFSYTGYKYVGLCVGIIARLFGSTIGTLVGLYTASMLSFFFLKTMVSIVPPSEQSNSVALSRHWVLLALSGLQFLVTVFLSWF